MATSGPTQANTRFAIDYTTNCVRFDRLLDASPAQVFAAWTKPEQVSCWWDPSGQALAACEIDLRPGGAFKFVTQGHPDMPFAGTYTEIIPDERLVFEALGAVGRVSIIAAADATKLSVEIQCRSAEHLQQFLARGIHEGTARTLDNLAVQIARH